MQQTGKLQNSLTFNIRPEIVKASYLKAMT